MPIRHVVEQGESLASIALAYGFAPDTLWSLPDNLELRQMRTHPNILMPGDVVHVPDKRSREASKNAGARYRFRRRGVPERLKIRFVDGEGRPRADVPYVLEVDGVLRKGRTGGDGLLVEPIPPDARRGVVVLGEGPGRRATELRFSHLDPLEEPSGIQGRLTNLGFDCGDERGAIGTRTRDAICRFQRACGLPVTGEIDEETRRALRDRHGD